MTSLPVSVDADSSLSDALRVMKSKAVSHLLVSDREKKLKGIISKQDVLDTLFILISRTTGRTYTRLEMENLKISEMMTLNPYSLNEEALSSEAAALLVKHNINCIPVVDATNTITGVVTSYDILKHSLQD